MVTDFICGEPHDDNSPFGHNELVIYSNYGIVKWAQKEYGDDHGVELQQFVGTVDGYYQCADGHMVYVIRLQMGNHITSEINGVKIVITTLSASADSVYKAEAK